MPPRRTSKQSKKFAWKRRNRMLVVSGASVVIVATFLYIASAISFVGPLTITAVQIFGIDSNDDKIAIRASAIEALQGSYASLFSRANTLIYPRGAIISNVKKLFPWIDSVLISRQGTHSLILFVREKDPTALVCTTLPDFNGTDLSLDDPGSCYFADGEGYLFKKAPSFSGNVYHRYYIPGLSDEASFDEVLVGKYATSTTEFKALEKLYSDAIANGIVSDAILMKPNNEYELYARNSIFGLVASAPSSSVNTASTVVIYFNTISSLYEQTSNLISFWKHMTEATRDNKRSIQFDSIDVRYGANVFYRENK